MLEKDRAKLERRLQLLCKLEAHVDGNACGVKPLTSDERRPLSSMYAGDGHLGMPMVQRVPGVLSRNMHSVDPLPLEGRLALEEGVVRLWPTASLVNHSFAEPNVTRCFVPGCCTLQFRALRDLRPGVELLDNYLDPCSTYAERARMMLRQHGLIESRHALDAAPSLAEAESIVASARESLSEGDADRCFLLLTALVDCVRGAADPALAGCIDLFAQAAHAAGLDSTSWSAWSRALGLLQGREPYSYQTVALCTRVALVIAKRTLAIEQNEHEFETDTLDAELDALFEEEEDYQLKLAEIRAEANRWVALSAKHWCAVFGGPRQGGSFEARNQELCALIKH